MTFRQRPGSDRSLHGPLQSFDLEAEVSRLREEKEWQEGRRNAITLRKGEGLSIVLLVMKAGDRLDEHSAPGPISLSIQEGRIRFTAEDEVVEAGTETMLTCDAGYTIGGGAERRRLFATRARRETLQRGSG